MLIKYAKKAIPKPVKDYIKSSRAYERMASLFMGSPINLFIDFVDCSLTPDERLFLYRKAKEVRKFGTVIEIGAYAGASTLFLGRGVDKSGASVFTIDPFNDYWDRQREEDDRTGCVHDQKPSMEDVMKNLSINGNGNVTLIKGFSTDVAETWNVPIDFLWIDGNHKQVREDYEAWEGFLKPGSCIAFHDANYPDMGYDFVTEVVDEIMEEDHWTDIERVDSIRFARRFVAL